MATVKDITQMSNEEIESVLRSRKMPVEAFSKNGVKYYDAPEYQRLLKFFDEDGFPQDFSAVEVTEQGFFTNLEPKYAMVNLTDMCSNRVFVDDDCFHVVFDTRTIDEMVTGDVTLESVPEFILTPDSSTDLGFAIRSGFVKRDVLLEKYTTSFDKPTALKILVAASKGNVPTSEISLPTSKVLDSKPKPVKRAGRKADASVKSEPDVKVAPAKKVSDRELLDSVSVSDLASK